MPAKPRRSISRARSSVRRRRPGTATRLTAGSCADMRPRWYAGLILAIAGETATAKSVRSGRGFGRRLVPQETHDKQENQGADDAGDVDRRIDGVHLAEPGRDQQPADEETADAADHGADG